MSSVLNESVYESQPEEHAFRVTNVSGTVPADLSGAFLRSSPGLTKLGDHYLNYFDGHALISGMSFRDGAATFRSRFVRTPLYEEETAKKAVVKRRIFTNHPSRWSNLFALDFGNGAMHDVYAWGEGDALRIVAGNDPGHFALDPRTLETKGPERWNGAAPKGHEMGPMPSRDAATGHLVGWVKKPGGLKPDQLKFVELDGQFRVVNETPFHALAASPAVVHDQRATTNWFVATEQAVRLAAGQAIWGATTAFEAFKLPPGATATLLLAPRHGGGPLIRVPLPAPVVIAFHVINAYEDGDTLIVDLVTYDGRIPFETFAPKPLRERVSTKDATPDARPMRLRVDPKAGRVVESRLLGERSCEPPEVADSVMGQRYRYAYFPTKASDAFPEQGFFGHFDAVCRIDVESGETRAWSPGCLVSSVSFVARPSAASEDDGWLLTWLHRPGGSAVAVLDAQRIEAGPVATLDTGVHLPAASHVRWAAGVQLQP
jgi:all-trans-8'-apo-beta-carotenal 15,15'-oxygenase